MCLHKFVININNFTYYFPYDKFIQEKKDFENECIKFTSFVNRNVLYIDIDDYSYIDGNKISCAKCLMLIGVKKLTSNNFCIKKNCLICNICIKDKECDCQLK